ncbi:MAG TPA: peptidylprolyl isomerase [Syntrophorhabdaceae bacterium]|jgi:FKBP-type peptidyl-prolyl cis-trans isomerase SlyD
MEISNHKAVTVQYTLKDDTGEIVDSSEGREPLFYIHGTDGLLPGFEKALDGKTKGDAISFSLAPKEGYGERNESLIFKLPRERFNDIEDLREGTQFAVNGPQGTMVMTAIEVGDQEVTLDGNHPLAGNTLHFSVEVLDVRDATEEELQESLSNTGCGCASDGPSECGCASDSHADTGCGCTSCSE